LDTRGAQTHLQGFPVKLGIVLAIRRRPDVGDRFNPGLFQQRHERHNLKRGVSHSENSWFGAIGCHGINSKIAAMTL
jgi:hypothetical protein